MEDAKTFGKSSQVLIRLSEILSLPHMLDPFPLQAIRLFSSLTFVLYGKDLDIRFKRKTRSCFCFCFYFYV